MNQHKDLPTGSQAWARKVDALMEENAHLKEVVRRLCENAGLDYSNPKRGLSSGGAPSTNNPVGQKLSSLADVEIYNVADEQVLTWSQQGQRWMPATPVSGGAQWRKATDAELKHWDLAADSEDTDTTPQVMGVVDPDEDDGWGLVGTGTATAFVHAAQRWFGGPTRAHGYVAAQPYYCEMGVTWIEDNEGGWDEWGNVKIDRDEVWITTPTGKPSNMASSEGALQRDGSIVLRTNWFYLPQVNGVQYPQWNINYPRRPVPLGSNPSAGAMVYDMTLNKPLFWNGTEWRDAMNNAVPAASY